MKKLLTALFVVATTFLCAAQVSWSAYSLDKNFEGGTGYLVKITSGKSIAEIAEILSNDGIATDTPEGYEGYLSNKPVTLSASGKNAQIIGAFFGDPQGDEDLNGDYFLIVLDKDQKNFTLSEIETFTAKPPSNVAEGDFYSGYTTGKVAAVPEPTVLALLALGVAGVALRRKKVVA